MITLNSRIGKSALQMEALRGRQVLVIDDDIGLSETLNDVLEDLGALPQPPVHNFTLAVAAAAGLTPDTLVVLDVDLGGTLSFPVAQILESRGVPFILISGRVRYEDCDMRPHWVLVSKPFRVGDLCAALAGVLRCPK